MARLWIFVRGGASELLVTPLARRRDAAARTDAAIGYLAEIITNVALI